MTAVWFVWLESGYMLVLLLVVVRQSWNVIDIGSSIYCVKLVRISSCSGPYFPAFELNIDRYSVSICIQSECRKIRTRKTPNTDTFHKVIACGDSELATRESQINLIFGAPKALFILTGCYFVITSCITVLFV